MLSIRTNIIKRVLAGNYLITGWLKENGMNTWLKLIGSSDKPLTDPPHNGTWTKDYVGFRKTRKPGIRKGDQLFLYAPGGSRSIFAMAEAVTDPLHDTNYNPREDGSCRWKIQVKYLVNLPVASGIKIDEITLPVRNLAYSVRQQSHIKLSPQESKNAYQKLKDRATAIGK